MSGLRSRSWLAGTKDKREREQQAKTDPGGRMSVALSVKSCKVPVSMLFYYLHTCYCSKCNISKQQAEDVRCNNISESTRLVLMCSDVLKRCCTRENMLKS